MQSVILSNVTSIASCKSDTAVDCLVFVAATSMGMTLEQDLCSVGKHTTQSALSWIRSTELLPLCLLSFRKTCFYFVYITVIRITTFDQRHICFKWKRTLAHFISTKDHQYVKYAVGKHINFESLSSLDQEIIQSDIGVFWGSATSKNYNICPAHVKLFKDNHKSRLRRYACNVPTFFASEHDYETQKNKNKFGRAIRGDRRVSSDQMRTIYTEHGVVIPIRTCICRVCRRKWLGQKGNDEKCNDVICGPPCTDLGEDDFIENTAQLKWDSDEMEELNVNLKDIEHVECLPTLSQTTSTCITEDSSQNSQISDSSLVQTDKLSNLNIFLQQSGVSPVKHMRGSFLSSERTQRRYLQKANDCLAVMIPGLTSYRYYAAKNHISEVGCGLPIQEMKQTREKIDPCQLEPFLDFITSSHNIKDLPFGERKLKLSTGEIISTPNVIRAIAPTSIIRQYKQFCEDEEIRPLGTSTMCNILEECAASVRHSVEGLDYYVAEGGRAFRDIEEILEGFDCEDEDIKKMKADLLEVKRYLKSDYKVEKAVDDIKEWKGHILHNQKEARRHTLEIIKEKKDVMITIDWAMKFLPRKFRKGQTDWFAKRGINWHISVSLMKGSSDTYQSITHVHLFSSTVAQDSSVTSSIISDVVQDLIQMNQGLSNVHLFSDNAGCYKSTTTIAALYKTLKGTIKTYNFCEAQDGKGPCDRRASHLKSIIKRYVNEGNDRVTAEQMKKSFKYMYGLSYFSNYRVKVVTPVIDLDPVQKSIKSIPGISQLHNFKFEDSCLRVWKAYGIGAGKLIPWTDICQDMNVSQLKTVQNWLEKSCNVFSSDDMTEEEVEECEPPAKKAKSE
ncbi:unnamed protein product [Mytilus coruscus]|uniref:Uncharacterized protein n=1 Tax=Mytilus coruscus TaxID=42192 RepID=A0A6J8EE16_MYTCO|nr:unnamed protein product [Mytilus coruscus]